MLEACGLRKRWGSAVALAGFDLRIEAGEICGLLGHNGAGKTTFARICAGLERPDAGRVRIAGVDVGSRSARARALVGHAPQEIALYPAATLRENLRFFGGIAGVRGSALRREIDELAETMMLADVLDRAVSTLSGGQQRRAQAATALVHRPAVLLLDEPTVGADPVTRQALLAAVRDRAAQGAAVCYTTHYLPELEVLDASIAVAYAGRVVARGARGELLAGLPGRLELAFTAQSPSAVARRAAAAGQAAVVGQAERADRAEPTETPTDGVLRFVTEHPGRTLARILAALGDDGEQVERVEIREPTLDDLYQHLTAREKESAHVR